MIESEVFEDEKATEDYVIYYYENTVLGKRLFKKCFTDKKKVKNFIANQNSNIDIDAIYIEGKRAYYDVEIRIELKRCY